jgi:hypothetical protein
MSPPPHVWQQIESQADHEGQRAEGRGQDAKAGGQGAKAGWRQAQWRPAWALATAALVIAAFLTGRLVEHRTRTSTAGTMAGAQAVAAPAAANANAAANVRERVLLVAVGDHLERSQMVLVELANAHTRDALDISAERQSADELLASNRLYRQTAAQIGQTGVADLLDDLERVLVEVANGPSHVSMQELAAIQQRIEAQGILFKVKIIGSDIRERGNSTTAGRTQPVS